MPLSSSQMNLSMSNLSFGAGGASRPAPMPPGSSNFSRKGSIQPNTPMRPFAPPPSLSAAASNGSPSIAALAAEFSGRSKSISMPRGALGMINGSEQMNGAPALAP